MGHYEDCLVRLIGVATEPITQRVSQAPERLHVRSVVCRGTGSRDNPHTTIQIPDETARRNSRPKSTDGLLNEGPDIVEGNESFSHGFPSNIQAVTI